MTEAEVVEVDMEEEREEILEKEEISEIDLKVASIAPKKVIWPEIAPNVFIF